MKNTFLSKIKKDLRQSAKLKIEVSEQLAQEIERLATVTIRTYKKGNKLLLCGNGGSAADCQHIAAELVGRFKKERKALPAISLATDTSILTAVTNDYWYDLLFARQIEALGHLGDLLYILSTSGK